MSHLEKGVAAHALHLVPFCGTKCQKATSGVTGGVLGGIPPALEGRINFYAPFSEGFVRDREPDSRGAHAGVLGAQPPSIGTAETSCQ